MQTNRKTRVTIDDANRRPDATAPLNDSTEAGTTITITPTITNTPSATTPSANTPSANTPARTTPPAKPVDQDVNQSGPSSRGAGRVGPTTKPQGSADSASVTEAAGMPTVTRSSDPRSVPVPSPLAAAWQGVVNLVHYTLFNRSPTVSLGPPVTLADGNVVVDPNGQSNNGFGVSYALGVAPRFGSVLVDPHTGRFVYTPGPGVTPSHAYDGFSVIASNGAQAQLPGLLGMIQSLLHHAAQQVGLAQSDSTDVTVTLDLRDPSVLAAAAQRAEPAIARIDTGAGRGTGVVVSSGGTVLTAFHVVAETKDVTVIVGGRRYGATVAGYDRSLDIAVLHLRDAVGLPTITAAEGPLPRIGQWVAALGNARGNDEPLTRAMGTVVAVDQSDTFLHPWFGHDVTQRGLVETAIARNPGDSGGPVVDQDGALVGIVTSADFDDDTGAPKPRSFAIPAAAAFAVVEAVDRGMATSAIHLGPQAHFGAALGISPPGAAGVAVTDIDPGSAAAAVGLRPGDRLTHVGGQAVAWPLSVLLALDGYEPGDLVDVAWTDAAGDLHSASARLG